MKTKSEINEMMTIAYQGANELRLLKNDVKSKKQLARIKKEVKRLKEVKLYLETAPREEFVKEEIERLSRRIEQINGGYKEWLKAMNKTDSIQAKKEYREETGIAVLNRQIQTLRFIFY
jgi:NAD-specific glutamate dehydrogenase